MRRLLAPLVLLLLGATATAAELPLRLEVSPTRFSESVGDGDRIGKIRILSLLDLPSVKIGELHFAQLSGLAWDDDDEILYAVSDKGSLFHLRPEFSGERLTGLHMLEAVPLRGLRTREPIAGLWSDAEGLDIRNGRNGRKGDAELVVSFEHRPRIVAYTPEGHAVREYPLPAPLDQRKAYHNENRMLESVCIDPGYGILTVPESPLDGEPEGLTRIFGLNARTWRYAPALGRISAMECLGNGKVLLLERELGNVLRRNAVMLRRAQLPAEPSPTQPVAAETLATLDLADGLAIDNFEGLARHRGNRYFMVSDDNNLFVQRTLLLYFEIVD
jgi:hypothetical protein